MLFAQLEAVVKNAIDTLSCHSRLVFNIIIYINLIHNLITKWGGLAPPFFVIVIVIVIFKQGVRSAQADFQRSPVYITHTTNSNIYTYKLAIHIIHTKKYNKNITTKHRHKTKNKLQQNQYKTKKIN